MGLLQHTVCPFGLHKFHWNWCNMCHLRFASCCINACWMAHTHTHLCALSMLYNCTISHLTLPDVCLSSSTPGPQWRQLDHAPWPPSMLRNALFFHSTSKVVSDNMIYAREAQTQKDSCQTWILRILHDMHLLRLQCNCPRFSTRISDRQVLSKEFFVPRQHGRMKLPSPETERMSKCKESAERRCGSLRDKDQNGLESRSIYIYSILIQAVSCSKDNTYELLSWPVQVDWRAFIVKGNAEKRVMQSISRYNIQPCCTISTLPLKFWVSWKECCSWGAEGVERCLHCFPRWLGWDKALQCHTCPFVPVRRDWRVFTFAADEPACPVSLLSEQS